MNLEPSMTSASARTKVTSALRAAGYDVRPGTKRSVFPYAIRVARVEEGQQTAVWEIVHGIDAGATEVRPASSFTHD